MPDFSAPLTFIRSSWSIHFAWSSYSIVANQMYVRFALWFGGACTINSSDYISLDHPVTIAFMKVFKINVISVVDKCQQVFGFDTLRRQIIKRKINFLVKLCKTNNSVGATVATDELILLKQKIVPSVIANLICRNLSRLISDLSRKSTFITFIPSPLPLSPLSFLYSIHLSP